MFDKADTKNQELAAQLSHPQISLSPKLAHLGHGIQLAALAVSLITRTHCSGQQNEPVLSRPKCQDNEGDLGHFNHTNPWKR